MSEEQKEWTKAMSAIFSVKGAKKPKPPEGKGCVAKMRRKVYKLVEGDKVAIVAMESCEFCWTAFKLFDALGVSYKTLNFDALEYAHDLEQFWTVGGGHAAAPRASPSRPAAPIAAARRYGFALMSASRSSMR